MESSCVVCIDNTVNRKKVSVIGMCSSKKTCMNAHVKNFFFQVFKFFAKKKLTHIVGFIKSDFK